MTAVRTKERDPYFDLVKAFAMLCVVMSHFWQAAGHYSVEHVSFLANFFTAVDMPIFFMLSGMFAGRLVESGDVRRLIVRIWGYLWPAAALAVLFAAINFFAFDKDVGQLIPLVWSLFWGKWFLIVLSYCCVLLFFYNRIKSIVWRIVFCALVAGVLLILPDKAHINALRYMLPHFCLGLFVFRAWKVWESNLLGVLTMAIFSAVILLEGNVMTNGMGFYWATFDVRAILSSWRAIILWAVSIMTGVCGYIAVLWVLRKFVDYCQKVEVFASFGTTTLGVYLLHQQLLGYVERFGFRPISFTGCLAGAVLLFLFCHYCVIGWRAVGRRWQRKGLLLDILGAQRFSSELGAEKMVKYTKRNERIATDM